jgi:hypothetical protein
MGWTSYVVFLRLRRLVGLMAFLRRSRSPVALDRVLIEVSEVTLFLASERLYGSSAYLSIATSGTRYSPERTGARMKMPSVLQIIVAH